MNKPPPPLRLHNEIKTETKQKNQLTHFKVFGSDILLSENYSESIIQSFLSLSVCPLISQGTPEFSNS